MKKSELIFNLISIPVDAIMLLLAGIVSFYLRLQPDIVAKIPIKFNLQINSFIVLSVKVIPVLLLIFALFGLYNLRGSRKFPEELGKIAAGISLGLLIIILMFFFNQDFNQNIFPSRFIILAAWGLGILFVVCGRLVLKWIQILLFKKNVGLHKLVIINGQNSGTGVIEKVYKNKSYGYEVSEELVYGAGILETLENLYRKNRIDELLQADSSLSDEINLKLVEFARNKGLQFSFVPNLFEVQRNAIETYNIRGVPVISLKNTPLDGWGKVAKRVMDVLIASVCLIITSPLFLLIAIAIKLDSKGKIIYTAMRGGCSKDFKFYKFRSMYNHLCIGEEYGGEEAEKVRMELWKKNDRGGLTSPFLKIKKDPRVTKVGRFLRKTKLDELPQFWNVLKGDMSMVGPRAHVLDEVERYRNRYRRMFSIKPGIFGMSQIAQSSWPDLPFEEEIKLNTYYIENWSVWLDIKILAKTFVILFFGSKPKEDY
ncbi:MAG: sugar transferase [Patescibacteria group bacterium]|nr:sugar transferase [Patescibacteria group bacterium]